MGNPIPTNPLADDLATAPSDPVNWQTIMNRFISCNGSSLLVEWCVIAVSKAIYALISNLSVPLVPNQSSLLLLDQTVHVFNLGTLGCVGNI